MKNINQKQLASTFAEGLSEMKKGLEKIKESEKLYENDPWFFDWVVILSERIKVFETASSHELNIVSKHD